MAVPIIGDLRSFLELVPDVADTGPVRMLSRWFNCSLRHVSEHVSSIVQRIYTKIDAAYPKETIFPLGNDDNKHKRLRNYVLKTITCDHELIYDHSKGASNTYHPHLSTQLMPFPRIFLLDYLKQQNSGQSSFGTLREMFSCFAIEALDVKKLLDRMKKDQGMDGFGLLITNWKEGLNEIPGDDLVVELTDCGQFFTHVLRHTCEYLFWTALDTPVDVDLFGQFVKPNRDGRFDYEQTGVNQNFRLWVATQFLEKHIVKRIVQSKRALGQQRPAMAIFKSVYPRADFYARRTVDFLRKHLDSEDSCREMVLDALDKIESALDNI